MTTRKAIMWVASVDEEENELAIMEFIHCVVKTMDRYFGNVCELDIMFHIEKAHYLLDEMVANGTILDTNRTNVLTPLQMLDKQQQSS